MLLGSAILIATLIDKHYSMTQSQHLPTEMPASIIMLLEGIWTIALVVFYLTTTDGLQSVFSHVKNISFESAGRLLAVATIGILAGLWLEKQSNTHSEITVITLTLLISLFVEGYIVITGYTGKHPEIVSILVTLSILSWAGVYILS